MKILLISYSYDGSASGKITFRIAEELARRGHDLCVITAENNALRSGQYTIIEIKDFIKKGGFLDLLRTKVLTLLGFSAYNSHFVWRMRSWFRIRNLFKSWYPDWVYCRSTPIDACLVGTYVHKKYGIPTFQHFSDPLPAPSCPDNSVRKRFLKQTRDIITHSEMISFSTIEMANYIESMLDKDFSSKIFEIPDATDNNPFYIQDSHNFSCPIILVYLGSIYGTRNPLPLFQSIEMLSTSGIDCKLVVYSDAPYNAVVPHFVEYRGYTLDVTSALLRADILVDLDGDDDIPVFISSKLKDYLVIPRPILSITPSNSPAYHLLNGIPTVWTTNNEKNSIAKTIKQIIKDSEMPQKYDERFRFAQRFSPKAVVDKVLGIVHSIVHE